MTNNLINSLISMLFYSCVKCILIFIEYIFYPLSSTYFFLKPFSLFHLTFWYPWPVLLFLSALWMSLHTHTFVCFTLGLTSKFFILVTCPWYSVDDPGMYTHTHIHQTHTFRNYFTTHFSSVPKITVLIFSLGIPKVENTSLNTTSTYILNHIYFSSILFLEFHHLAVVLNCFYILLDS